MYNKLNLDGNYDIKYHGSIIYARNKVLDSTKKSLITEDGFEELVTIDSNIIGTIYTNYDIVIFSTTSTHFIIGYYNILSDTYTKVLNTQYIIHDTANIIQGIAYYNYKNELTCNFIDGVADTSNGIRSINLHNPQLNLNGALEFINPSDTSLLNYIPNVTIPNILYNGLNTSGVLQSGTYIVFIGYVLQDNKETHYINSSNPIYINYDRLITDTTNPDTYKLITGGASGTVTNASINLMINSIDSNATHLKVGIIYSNSKVKTAYSKNIEISGSTYNLIISDLNSFNIDTEYNILNVNSNYISANAITAFSNRAIYGYVKSRYIPELQKYINNISVNWISESTAQFYNYDSLGSWLTYKNDLMMYYNKTFTPNEVVALYVRLFGLDGTIIGDYHIPGRAPSGNETYTFVDGSAGAEEIDINAYPIYKDDYLLGDNVKLYQTRDTSNKTGLNNYGQMGYWENQNEQYNDSDEWDIYSVDGSGNPLDTGVTLKNANVRHHRFPSQAKLLGWFGGNYNNDKRILGLKISNIKFPTELKQFIGGYQIMYAVRTGTNNLVEDEGILHNIIEDSVGGHHIGYSNDNGVIFNDVDGVYVSRPYNIISNSNSLLSSYIVTNYNIVADNGCTFLSNSYTDYAYFGSVSGRFISLGLSNNLHTYSPLMYPVSFNNIGTSHLKVIKQSDILDAGSERLNVRNLYGDKFIVLDLDITNGDLTRYTGTTHFESTGIYFMFTSGGYYNVSFMMYRDSVYSTFNNQLLAKCSEIQSIDTDAITVYNGDTFIGVHGYKNCTKPSTTPIYTLYMYPTYSYNNVEYRYGVNTFYPNLAEGTLGWGEYLTDTGYSYLNPTELNIDSNILNTLIQNIIHNYKDNYVYSFPLRLLISDVNSSESIINKWNTINYSSYIDTDITKGEIIWLEATNNYLYIQKRNSLYVLGISDELIKTDDANITIQATNVFNSRLKEVIESDTNGYIGSNQKYGKVVTPYGIFVFDSDKCKVYLVNGDKATDITTGVYEYLLKFKEYINYSTSNPFTNTGVILGYNDKDKILIISFSTLGAQIETNENNAPDVTLAKSFTLSYNIENQGWVSFHKYLPVNIGNNRLNTFSIKYNRIYRHNNNLLSATYYKNKYDNNYVKHDDIVDYIFNSLSTPEGYQATYKRKIFEVFIIDGMIKTNNNTVVYDRIPDKLLVYNDTQCTAYIDCYNNSFFGDNPVKILDGKAYFNLLVDIVNNDNLSFFDDNFDPIFSNLGGKNFFDYSNFISKFAALRIVHINSDKVIIEKLILNSVYSNFKLLNE